MSDAGILTMRNVALISCSANVINSPEKISLRIFFITMERRLHSQQYYYAFHVRIVEAWCWRLVFVPNVCV